MKAAAKRMANDQNSKADRSRNQVIDETCHVPVRKISNKGARRLIGKFPSLKCKRSIMFESLLEMDFLYHLELDHKVLSYYEQPIKISYRMDRRSRIYVPDFRVIVSDTSHEQLVEVKPLEMVLKQLAKFRAITLAAEELGYDFKIVTEASIRKEPRLSNLKFLHRFASIKVKPDCLYEAIAYIKGQSGKATIASLEDHLSRYGFSRNELFKLVYKGELMVDLSSPLTPDAIVVLNQNFIES
jgi:hypothetical protein